MLTTAAANPGAHRFYERLGYLHVGQLPDYVKEGQIVRVKVLEADDKGRLRLSMKAAAEDAAAPAPASSEPTPAA